MMTREQTYTSKTSERFREFASRLGDNYDTLCEKIMLCYENPTDIISVEQMSEHTGRPEDDIRKAISCLPRVLLPVEFSGTPDKSYRVIQYVQNIM